MTTQPQNNDSHSHLFKIMTATLCTNGFEEELIQNYKILNSAGFRNTNKNVINTVTNISILKTIKRASGRNVCHLNVLCFFLVFLKLRDELFFFKFSNKIYLLILHTIFQAKCKQRLYVNLFTALL